ncbi:hypothetical protein DFH27DRAFT_656576 [Peziza echinospora]|nr:hypothetical protein DFH27DRAFT_656576 [Peziza echinospora]
MGAQRVGRMSLDFKLRDASHIKDVVMEFLNELMDGLNELCIKAQDGLGERGNDGETGHKHSDTLSAELTFLLDDIANIISCLYNLSVSIRQPAPLYRKNLYPDIDLTLYHLYDHSHVFQNFPRADQFLIERLGKANTERRLEITAKTTTTISVVGKDARLMQRPTVEDMEHDSDGGRTPTLSGTIVEATRGEESKAPDPPNARKTLFGEPFECPHCVIHLQCEMA